MTPAAFVEKWERSGAAERANHPPFVLDLCSVLGVPGPDPTVPEEDANVYTFERAVTRRHADGTETPGAQMDEGATYSGLTGGRVRQFNGSLFKDRTALALSSDGVTLLWEAARADWTGVEPAIFGTLLERALDPAERRQTGRRI